MACGANLLLPLRQCPVRPFALVSPFCSFRDAPAPAAALGLCPFAASNEGRTRRREQWGRGTTAPDLLPTALAGAAPTASAYWRYRWVLIMPSALAAIQMLKLFICSWVSSRQRRTRAAPCATAAPALSARRDAAPGHRRGRVRLPRLSIFVLGAPLLPGPADLSPPRFPQKQVPVCPAVELRIQPVSPSADSPPRSIPSLCCGKRCWFNYLREEGGEQKNLGLFLNITFISG